MTNWAWIYTRFHFHPFSNSPPAAPFPSFLLLPRRCHTTPLHSSFSSAPQHSQPTAVSTKNPALPFQPHRQMSKLNTLKSLGSLFGSLFRSSIKSTPATTITSTAAAAKTSPAVDKSLEHFVSSLDPSSASTPKRTLFNSLKHPQPSKPPSPAHLSRLVSISVDTSSCSDSEDPTRQVSHDISSKLSDGLSVDLLDSEGDNGGKPSEDALEVPYRLVDSCASATSAHGLPRPALAVRNLMEQAGFAHICTVMSRMHHRREGYPFGSLVDFAPDPMGHPIFSFSPLAIHTRNLLADPRCTLVVQSPGRSGLSNARVTIFGDVFPLPEDQQEWAHKHQGPSQQWGNFYYFRMQNISDIYFIGGFGTVAWVDVKEYEVIQPDMIAVDGGDLENLKELNAIFSKPLKELLSAETEVDDAALILIDSKGTDVCVRQGTHFNIQRLPFEGVQSIEPLEEAKEALWKLINKGQVQNLQK